MPTPVNPRLKGTTVEVVGEGDARHLVAHGRASDGTNYRVMRFTFDEDERQRIMFDGADLFIVDFDEDDGDVSFSMEIGTTNDPRDLVDDDEDAAEGWGG